MNYKKLIPNQKLRLRILHLLDFIPDRLMIHIQYRIKTKRKVNIDRPKRFTEKVQWYKLNHRDPLMTQCADKYAVRDYIVSKGYEDILVPIYGVYNDADEIDFEVLPEQFVLKTTNNSQTVMICRNKFELNFEETRQKLNEWLHQKSPRSAREWAYNDIHPRIIAEQYLVDETVNDLIDYKFMCFNGQTHYLYIVTQRSSTDGPKEGIYDLQLRQLPFNILDGQPIEDRIPPPRNFDRMIQIACDLSEDFPHVRVDLYNIQGHIYFGELTFYDSAGYSVFEPDEFDYILGEKFKIPTEWQH